jgi:hypothetical protein
MKNEGLKLVFYKVGRATWFRLSYDGRTIQENSIQGAMALQRLAELIRAKVRSSTIKKP